MPAGRVFACVLFALFTAVVGCDRDLGECNLDGVSPSGSEIPGPAALDIAYRSGDGLPMFEGQALTQNTCGDGSFCHAPAAVGGARVGVPAGLNFDVSLACNEAADPDCASPPSCEDGSDGGSGGDGGQSQTEYCEELRRLHDNQNQVNSWAEGMILEIRRGTMPPGEAGRRVRNNAPWVRESDGSALPSIESSEGQEIVRNWLACGAPVVARSETPASASDELEQCPSVDDEVCVYRGPEEELPAPAWSEIYFGIMFTECLLCHVPSEKACTGCDQNPDNPLGGDIPGGASAPGVTALDLSGSNATDTSNWASDSYLSVVDAPAADPGLCAGQGTLVIPFEPDNSIMIQKMRNEQTCGDRMPIGGSIGEARIQVVEQWIEMGAENN